MASLALLMWAEGAGDAAVARALRALGPMQAEDEVWLLRGGPTPDVGDAGADSGATHGTQRRRAWAPSVTELTVRRDEGVAAALNRAIAASRARWCLFWHASSVAAPSALEGLRGRAAAAERAATGAVPPWPALLVGVAEHRLGAEPSPLAHFLAARAAAATSTLGDGDDVPADAVPAHLWAAPRTLLVALDGLDGALGAPTFAVDFARRAYAAGVPLRLCRALGARRVGTFGVAESVAHWRALGRDSVALLCKHGDPHAMDRLVRRLGPYRRLLADAPALAAQLEAVDRRLVTTRRLHPAHVAGLQPSFTNLYAVSVLEGVLRHPAGAALWGERAPLARGAERRAQPPAAGPRRRPGAPRA